MSKVTIRLIGPEAHYGLFEDIQLEVNGVNIGSGTFGGEPEDNVECRTYSWVKELLAKLAKSLGAEVSFVSYTGTMETLWEETSHLAKQSDINLDMSKDTHKWEIETVSAPGLGEQDFWICKQCGTSGGPDGSPPGGFVGLFLAGTPLNDLPVNCDHARRLIDEFIVGYPNYKFIVDHERD